MIYIKHLDRNIVRGAEQVALFVLLTCALILRDVTYTSAVSPVAFDIGNIVKMFSICFTVCVHGMYYCQAFR